MSGTRVISTTSRRELSSNYFFSLQSKAPKEIQVILTEILTYFLPGRAKDLSAPLYINHLFFGGATVPQWARASSFTRFLDHTQRRTTVDRDPLDE